MAALVLAILADFWRADDDEEIQTLQVASWCRTLAGCSRAEVMDAWAGYQRDRNSLSENGRLRKPTAASLYHRVASQRPPAPLRVVATAPPAPRVRVQPETAARIMAENGFTRSRLYNVTNPQTTRSADE